MFQEQGFKTVFTPRERPAQEVERARENHRAREESGKMKEGGGLGGISPATKP